MTDHDLDALLRMASDAVEWPDTPDFAVGLSVRLPARPASTSRRGGLLRRPVVVALVLVLLAAATAGAVQPVRHRIERFLGIAGGEKVQRTTHVAPGTQLKAGRPVTLATARRLAPFRILLPDGGPAPSAVRFGGDLGAGAVSLSYGPGTVLTEFPDTSIYPGIKQVAEHVVVRFLSVGASQGMWIGKGLRVLQLQSADGVLHNRSAALPGSGLLLWSHGHVALRLETRRGLEAALKFARSVR